MRRRLATIASLIFVCCGPCQAAEPIQPVWFGTFTNTLADGKISHDMTALVLKQDGAALSGSAGPTMDRQSPVSGHVSGDTITLHMDAAGGVDFVLRREGGHLKGTAKGSRVNAVLDLAPAPGLMPHDQLVAEILAADGRSFAAYEACDAGQYRATLSPALEFYQDNQPLKNQQEIVDSLNYRCAEGIKLRRELDRDSLIINSTAPDFAIEAGLQRIYSRQPDGGEHLDATVRFTLVWTKNDGTWRILRAVSYDHR